LPEIKTQRSDILRKSEIDQMLTAAERYPNGDRLQCIIALAWLFGKRITEILRLKRDNITIINDYLSVRFSVLKKKKRESAVPKKYTKRIKLDHPYVQYILDWINTIEEGYIFPSSSISRTDMVTTKYVNRDGKEVFGKYTYAREGGHLSRQAVHYYIKRINPKAWMHLFRESLATFMAENGATEEELMHWFDWDDIRTAHEYVKRGTGLTQKWSDRKW